VDGTPKPILCYVTDRRSLPAQAGLAGPAGASAESTESVAQLADVIARAIAAGIDWVQVREKDLSGDALFQLTREAVKRARGRARILVNDRLDVALAAGAGGVHLGEKSLPAESVVRWLRQPENAVCVPRDFLVGVSCHSLEAALAAGRAGADYIIFGPVFETPSKTPYGPAQGLARLSEVCRQASLPVLAIGGITLENAGSCLSAGAAGIAAIRLFQEAEDLAAAVRQLRALP
jgi:thiamine-phosphate pyrophosphorylase